MFCALTQTLISFNYEWINYFWSHWQRLVGSWGSPDQDLTWVPSPEKKVLTTWPPSNSHAFIFLIDHIWGLYAITLFLLCNCYFFRQESSSFFPFFLPPAVFYSFCSGLQDLEKDLWQETFPQTHLPDQLGACRLKACAPSLKFICLNLIPKVMYLEMRSLMSSGWIGS